MRADVEPGQSNTDWMWAPLKHVGGHGRAVEHEQAQARAANTSPRIGARVQGVDFSRASIPAGLFIITAKFAGPPPPMKRSNRFSDPEFQLLQSKSQIKRGAILSQSVCATHSQLQDSGPKTLLNGQRLVTCVQHSAMKSFGFKGWPARRHPDICLMFDGPRVPRPTARRSLSTLSGIPAGRCDRTNDRRGAGMETGACPLPPDGEKPGRVVIAMDVSPKHVFGKHARAGPARCVAAEQSLNFTSPDLRV